MSGCFAVIAGGGTGGHVYPGLALAEELVARGYRKDQIHWVGGTRGLEGRAVATAGFGIDLLPGRGLQRRLTPANVVANTRTVTQTAAAFARARRLLARLRPVVVVGVGGYASLPAVVAARSLRIPVVVHEQNAAPGLANRIAVRLGATPAVSLPGTPLRGAVVTGNPVRAAVAAVVRRPVAEPALVVVFGGSLGARTLNRVGLALYDAWRYRADVAVHHVSGHAGHEETAAGLEAARRTGDAVGYRLVAYEDDMPGLYATAAVVVGRAGATTVAELAAAGVPSVLVPLPGAPGDHQTHNAMALVDAGAATLVPDTECDGPRLAAELEALLADPTRLVAMGGAARTIGNPDAAARLGDLVEEKAGEARPSRRPSRTVVGKARSAAPSATTIGETP